MTRREHVFVCVLGLAQLELGLVVVVEKFNGQHLEIVHGILGRVLDAQTPWFAGPHGHGVACEGLGARQDAARRVGQEDGKAILPTAYGSCNSKKAYLGDGAHGAEIVFGLALARLHELNIMLTTQAVANLRVIALFTHDVTIGHSKF